MFVKTRETYLFSIDLEDVRLLIPGGEKYRERVPELTRTLLDFLHKFNVRITFFVVGEIARIYPDLIKEIMAAGHEVACHTDKHVPLDKLGPKMFKEDLLRNIEALIKAGAGEIHGFRAPTFSLVESTSWAYKIIHECGLIYSSSVLPARSPLYGWENFGHSLKLLDGIWEIPMTLGSVGPLRIPFGGGIYFRVLPLLFLQLLFKRAGPGPILGYLHPYDIDTEQERFMHPGISDNKFYNWLMYYGRRGALGKFSKFLGEYEVKPYIEHIRHSV